VLALVAVVAIAATGSTPLGSGATRGHDQLLDALLTFVLVAALPALALYVYGLLYAYDFASSKNVPIGGAAAFLVFTFAFALAAFLWLRSRKPAEAGDADEPTFPGSPFGTELPRTSESSYDPQFSWITVAVVFALTAAGVLSMYLSVWRAREGVRRHRRTVAEAIATALDESVEDLVAEADARRAVIASYARLECVLAAHELPRQASETPDELLARILPLLDVDRRSIRRLTDLFTWAKFSDHDVDTDMKEEAIAALERVRDELREAAEDAERARIRSLRTGGSPA